MTTKKTNPWRAALAAGLACMAATAQAEPAPWGKIKLSDVVQQVSLGGDLRLRYDAISRRGANTVDRNRNRLRLRVGADVQLPDNVLLGLRLASGTGEQASTNQTYGNLSSQKGIYIDRAYAQWKPSLSPNGSITLTSGKMPMPLWWTYSSDLIWDPDLNPEGFGEGAQWILPNTGIQVFANAMQMVAGEQSSAGKNQWVFSQQLGAETPLPMAGKLRLAAAYHKWSDENRNAFAATCAQDGNRRTAASTSGVLLNRFGVGELTGQLSTAIDKTPLSFQATLARNFRARNNDTTVTGPRARDGYQFGLILGEAKAAHTWELAYFKKYAQTDATVADVADSDFGDGGTNRSGHIFWAAYAPASWLQLKAKYFVTNVIDPRLSPGDKAVNRLLADVSLRF